MTSTNLLQRQLTARALEAAHLRRILVAYAKRGNLTAAAKIIERARDFIRLHERIRTVQKQHVESVYP